MHSFTLPCGARSAAAERCASPVNSAQESYKAKLWMVVKSRDRTVQEHNKGGAGFRPSTVVNWGIVKDINGRLFLLRLVNNQNMEEKPQFRE